jgi:apolipoprotein N-acyltransferase
MVQGKNSITYAVLGGLLLSLSWFYSLTAIIFIAFVPLLILEKQFSESDSGQFKKTKFTLLVYLMFLIWNIGVTWWVWYASAGGALMAILANSLLMTTVFITFSNIKNKLKKPYGIWLLIPIWMAWEHGHTLWDLTWPWLTLGNIMAYKTNWIQWYEFTGTSGGTLWILAVNIILFNTLTQSEFNFKATLKPIALIAVPIFISYIILFSYKNNSSLAKQNIVVVQPNIDPYNDKFSKGFPEQFSATLKLAKEKLNQETNFLILPETFVTSNINEDLIFKHEDIQLFEDSILALFPNLNIVTGLNTYRFYEKSDKPSATARFHDGYGLYYDVYNTGFLLNKTSRQLYHKSKLVPGVELMPFPALLKPLESLAIDMGGTIGSLGTQKERTVFKGNNGINGAPVICYESVYADYCSEYVRNGAHFIFIITNDGWWDNTPGHKQHLNYARLRAIENRRCIARSANTGISAFIDETGNLHQTTNWWEEAVISDTLQPNDALTFFSRFGDILSRIAVVLTLLLLPYYWFLRFFKR